MYNPLPPRVWSRVQNNCTFLTDSSYNSVYIPLTNQTTSLGLADIQEKIQYKGNILQYKNNSSRLTKKQQYSQICKGFGANRTKVFATQTQTYTNPNTTGLKRINYIEIPYPNQIVGLPNNPSGPFSIISSDCSNNIVQDEGSLICNTFVKPCSTEIIQTVYKPQCFPSYCSNVPGYPIELCWNPKLSTFFPRKRYIMNNSNNKWPVNYKGFISAIQSTSI
jgi:hypothetical protein